MSKEELEKLKQELKEELRVEMQTAIESTKKYSYWTIYTKEYITPILEKKFEDNRIKYQFQMAINTFARILAGKDHISKITNEDLDNIKPVIENILKAI